MAPTPSATVSPAVRLTPVLLQATDDHRATSAVVVARAVAEGDRLTEIPNFLV